MLHFSPPTLETRVRSSHPADNAALWLALTQLADQDPLINLRTNEEASEIFVSLYGEVQKEVIQATLAADFRPVEELESRLGLREQHPDRFARNVSDAQKAEVAAYAACREAAGYGAPLPKVAVDRLRETLPPLHAPDDRETFTLYGPDHRPAQR